MKFLRNFLLLLYRIWFYILLAIPIVILFPVLIISILREAWYPLFFRLARLWATFILFGMGLIPKIEPKARYVKGQSYMFISNHTSMTDIMLMLYTVRNPFVFVGKKELGRIPLFGFFYKRTCILVDRNDAKSRLEVFNSAQMKLNQGLSVCIFPEGGVPDDSSVVLDEFKDGAFRLAIEHKIPIAPMTFHDNKRRFSYDIFSNGGPGRLRVKVHDIVPTVNLKMEDKRKLKHQIHQLLLNELHKPSVH